MLVQCFLLVVLLWPPAQICWLCLATKGQGDLCKCFTNFSENANFFDTYLQVDPWDQPPPYSFLEAFSVSMIMPDLLHILNLGVSRDVCGSILKVLVKGGFLFVANTIEEKLAIATQGLTNFARSHSLPLRFKKLSKKRLCWGKYAELKGSGYDLYVVSRWLEELLQPFTNIYPDFATLLWSLNGSMNLLYNSGWYLEETTRVRVKHLGTIFMRTYLKLASQSIVNQDMMFRCKPKLHLLHHIFQNRRLVNPAKYATWLDEDFLKHIAKTLKLVNSGTAQLRCLQRWLLGIPLHIQKCLNDLWNHKVSHMWEMMRSQLAIRMAKKIRLPDRPGARKRETSQKHHGTSAFSVHVVVYIEHSLIFLACNTRIWI